MTALRVEAAPPPITGSASPARSTSCSFTTPACRTTSRRSPGSAIRRARSRRTISCTPDGRVLQLVPEERRAWHAGAALWGGESDINSRSIGIEIANAGHPGRPARISRCTDRGADRALPRDRGAASHPAASRARPFRRGARQKARSGRALSLGAARRRGDRAFRRAGADRRRPRPAARRCRERRSRRCRRCSRSTATASRSPANSTSGREDVVAAFQRHFRPARVDGVADRSTLETLQRLLAALP